jgi:hypothetical protein
MAPGDLINFGGRYSRNLSGLTPRGKYRKLAREFLYS